MVSGGGAFGFPPRRTISAPKRKRARYAAVCAICTTLPSSRNSGEATRCSTGSRASLRPKASLMASTSERKNRRSALWSPVRASSANLDWVIGRCKHRYMRGQMPLEAEILAIGIDRQGSGALVSIRAFGILWDVPGCPTWSTLVDWGLFGQ
jgi:hypothetical protein